MSVRRRRTTVSSLVGKKVLITGAASGIGRATAQAAAEAGARLVLTDIAADGLTAAAEEIASRGGTVVLAEALDVSDFEAVTRFGAAVHASCGPLDVVMNVAGISAWGTVENLEHRHWKSMVDVNLMGPIHVIETFLPPMIEAGHGGYLVNVSSSAGLLAYPWHAAYSAAKYGLRGVSEVLRFDLERHGIGVSLVVPGAVKTPLVGTVQIAGVDREDPRVQKLQHRFESRAASPESVATAILEGMARGHFLVYSSNDIRVLYWISRKFAFPYEFAMRAANAQFTKLLPRR